MAPVWQKLQHNGVAFPEEYAPKGLKLTIWGKKVDLTPLAEEMAYHFAKKKDTPYVKDPVFATNFMHDLAKELPPEYRKVGFGEVDFSEFYALVDEEKRHKESMSKEAKKDLAAQRKMRKEELRKKFGLATVDGKEVEVANWMVEPPGLFMGRGSAPLRGHWKPRVTQKDVILNLDEGVQASPEWGKVVHDHESVWFAKWIDKLTDREKYVWPHESSHIQQSRNKEKYEKAARMSKNLEKIRGRILKAMSSRNLQERKVATVCYLIDRLGMRVGDEKDEDEADTVGATTLRVEHLKISEAVIQFDFLGKDSVSGDTELYYQIDGRLNYSSFEELLRRVTPAKYWKDSEGRELVVPSKPLEVLTTNDLDQRKAEISWAKVTEIIAHEVKKPIFEVTLAGGRRIKVTGDHSLFKQDKRTRYFALASPVRSMAAKDSVATISTLPIDQNDILEVNSVPITDDLLTFCGLWLADGCCTQKAVIIAAGGDENILSFVDSFSVSYHSEIKGLLEKSIRAERGIALSNYERGRAQTTLSMLTGKGIAFGYNMTKKGDIWCFSVTLRRVLQRLELTGDSGQKDIPEWVHMLSARQIGCFLRGYFSGDGCVSGDEYSPILASSISRNLIEHVRVLLLRLGVDCIINQNTGKSGFEGSGPQWVLNVGRNQSKMNFISSVGFLQKSKNDIVRLSRIRYRRFPIAWRKIRSVVPVRFHDRVYDLSVQGTERFIANGVLAHNSVRWVKAIDRPEKVLVENLTKFVSGKRADAEVFDGVSSSKVNGFFSGVIPGLTAKVFRTYHATVIAESYLRTADVKAEDEIIKKYHARMANLQAAIFCNHKRTPPKNWEESLKKKEELLKEYESKHAKEERLKKVKLDIELAVKTRDYNLNTSLKNYIDPRVYKAWCDYVGLDWTKLYTKSLQRKFEWVSKSRTGWVAAAPPAVAAVAVASTTKTDAQA